jgi:predicted phage tail protein
MTDETKIIRGSGGPPKPPPPPYRAPDTLHSRSFATVQDLISEGEIEGFASASKEGLTKGTTAYDNASLKDVFLDDTPILAADATSASPADTDFNFQDVTFKSKFGTSNQTAMSGIPAESRSPTGVSVEVTTSAPVTRQITNTDVDAVIVTLTWPQIQVAEDDGDIRGDTVEYKIQVQHDSGGFVDKISASVSGRTADAYARDHRIDLTSGFTTVDVRVVRVTADSTDAARVNAFQFTSLQEVIDNSSTYANSAYVALRLDSKQFNRIPTRKYRIRGVKVRIPGASASVVSATYTQSTTVVTVNNNNHGLLVGESVVFTATSGAGVNGTFVIQTVPDANSFTLTSSTSQTVTTSNCTFAGTPNVDLATGRIRYPSGYVFNGVMAAATYTNCPAMCLLDLLTNTRYGLGDHVTDSNLDLFSFVAASKYANEEVDDGTGSGAKEARFSCNVNIQTPKEAFAAINDLAGVMRCMPIWSAGSVTISQDKPTTASYLFNLANVSEGGFAYSGSSLKTRHSVVSVSYFNMDSKEVDFEVVEDSTAISKLGTIVKQVKAFACTSRNQAARLGRAILFAEQNESETVTFSASIDAGIVVRPGSVIEVNDPVRAGARRGGRVVAATTTTITIDALADTTLSNLANSVTISVILPDGTVETGSVSSVVGAVFTVNSVTKSDGTTQSAFSSAPNVNAPYLISSTDLQTQLFRVIQVEEQDDINYVITALSYVEGKYAFIEDGTALPTRTISLLNAPASPPSNLTVSEKIVTLNNMARSKLIVDWQPVDGVTQYLVNYKFEDTNFISQVVFSSDFEILDSKRGTYTIEVYSFNAALNISPNSTEKIFVAEGKTAVPENVQNLTIESINDQFVRLRFKQATAVDVLHGGRVYIRHTNLTGGSATFQAAQDIIEAVPGNSTEAICPALPGTYLVKFQDDGLRFSTTEASVSITLPEILDSITVKTDREDTDSTPFNGTKTNVVFDSSKGGLKLIDPSANATGTYDFVETLDLGATFSLTLKRHFQGAGFYVGDQFDNRTDNIDTWTDFDGSIANDANALLAVRTTTDNPSSSPTYGSFNTMANGIFKGRGFQFRATLETNDVAQNMNLQQLGYTATLPSRTEQSAVIASGSGAKAVTFAAPFFVGTSGLGNANNFLPSVSISPQNMATGDYFELSSISGTGFTVHFKNSSNASIDRNFTYSAVGFGKGG